MALLSRKGKKVLGEPTGSEDAKELQVIFPKQNEKGIRKISEWHSPPLESCSAVCYALLFLLFLPSSLLSQLCTQCFLCTWHYAKLIKRQIFSLKYPAVQWAQICRTSVLGWGPCRPSCAKSPGNGGSKTDPRPRHPLLPRSEQLRVYLGFTN